MFGKTPAIKLKAYCLQLHCSSSSILVNSNIYEILFDSKNLRKTTFRDENHETSRFTCEGDEALKLL